MTPLKNKFRAVALLDRDGTLIEECHYLSSPDQINIFPETIDALKLMESEGIAKVLTTNQSGIARGYFSEEKLTEIHDRMNQMLAEHSVKLDGIYYSPAHPKDKDPRRKPGVGMYEDAKRDLNLGEVPVYAVGDRFQDVEFGLNCGGKGIRVLTGQHLKDDVKPDFQKQAEGKRDRRIFTAENILEAARLIFADLTKSQFPHDFHLHEKFNHLEETARRVAQEKEIGNRVVLVNGCFDILHGGHISYLESARKLGDRLVLAVNSDQSIERLKGNGRPLMNEPSRLSVLANLRCIDYLTVFHLDSADHVLEIIKPTIHAKGTDYTEESVPERATADRLGIQVKIAGAPKENSTRDIIEVVIERAKSGKL